jgi:hypothetical protein
MCLDRRSRLPRGGSPRSVRAFRASHPESEVSRGHLGAGHPNTPNAAGIRLCRARFSTAGPSLRAVRSPDAPKITTAAGGALRSSSLPCGCLGGRSLTCRHAGSSLPVRARSRGATLAARPAQQLGSSRSSFRALLRPQPNPAPGRAAALLLIGSRLLILIVISPPAAASRRP